MSINRDYSQDRPPDKLYLQWYVDPDSYIDPDEIAPPGDPIVAHPEDRTYSENEPVYEHDVLYVRANPWIDVNDRLPVVGENTDISEISDGYHTLGELYEHRHALFLAVCRAYNGWKSLFHDDGITMAGWFIAGVETPEGMATYHVPLEWWTRFNVRELERAPKWDGHTSEEVIARIQTLTPPRLRETFTREVREIKTDVASSDVPFETNGR